MSDRIGSRRLRPALGATAGTLVATVLVAGLTAGPAAAHCGGPHSTAPDAVVLSVREGLTYWGSPYPDGTDVTVYGDGRVVIKRPVGVAGDPAPEPLVLQAGQAGVERALHAAMHAGLYADTDYGQSLVTDQGTTTIDVATDAVQRHVAIYALLLHDGDHGLTQPQQRARRQLRRFLHRVADPTFFTGRVMVE